MQPDGLPEHARDPQLHISIAVPMESPCGGSDAGWEGASGVRIFDSAAVAAPARVESAMTAAHEIAANTTILVLSRLAMLATPILLTAVGGIFWLNLDIIAADASTVVDTSNKLSTRVTMLESTQSVGCEDRIRYQDQVLAQLVKLTDKVDNQASQIAALTATLEAVKARPR